jgi:hypothetical protein
MFRFFFILFLFSSCHEKISVFTTEATTIKESAKITFTSCSSLTSRKICYTNDRDIILASSIVGACNVTLDNGTVVPLLTGRSSLITRYDENLNLNKYTGLYSQDSNSRIHFNHCSGDFGSNSNLFLAGYINGKIVVNNKQIFSKYLNATYQYPYILNLDKDLNIIKSVPFDDAVQGDNNGQMQSIHSDKNKLTILGHLNGHPPLVQSPRLPSSDDALFGEFNLESESFNRSLSISGENSDSAQHAPLIKAKDGGWLLNILSNSNIIYIGDQEIKRPASISSDRYVSYIIKLNSSYKIEWYQTMKGDSSRTFLVRDIVEVSDGFIIVFGANYNFTFNGNSITTIGSNDVYLYKLNKKGEEAWIKQFGSTGSDDAVAHPLATDPSGNIYLILTMTGTLQAPSELNGLTLSAGATSNNLLLKLSSNGNIINYLQINSTTGVSGTLEWINDWLYIYGNYTGAVTVGNYNSGALPTTTGILLKLRL